MHSTACVTVVQNDMIVVVIDLINQSLKGNKSNLNNSKYFFLQISTKCSQCRHGRSVSLADRERVETLTKVCCEEVFEFVLNSEL